MQVNARGEKFSSRFTITKNWKGKKKKEKHFGQVRGDKKKMIYL